MPDLKQYIIQQNEVDFKKIIFLIAKNWLLISIITAITLSIGYIMIRYSIETYFASGTLLIKDKKNTSLSTDAILEELDLFNIKRNIETEIEILMSRSLVKRALSGIDVNVSYFHTARQKIKDHEYYKDPPFIVETKYATNELYNKVFNVKLLDNNKFVLTNNGNKSTYHFGAAIKEWGITVTKNFNNSNNLPDVTYLFIVHDTLTLINKFKARLEIFPPGKKISVIKVSFKDRIPERARDFINAVLDAYISREKEDKTQILTNTIKFIDSQLKDIQNNLLIAEFNLEKYKTDHGIVDLEKETELSISRLFQYDKEKVISELELQSLDSLYSYIIQNKDLNLIAPAFIEKQDPLLSLLIKDLIVNQSRKRYLLTNSSELNPAIKQLMLKIEDIKASLVENINNVRKSALDNLNNLKIKIKKYEKNLNTIPATEREYIGIQRHFVVNENIYM